MAEVIVLWPKRKMVGFVGSADFADVVNHIATTISIPGSPVSGETVAYWHVREEMKIPVGTDKYR